MRHSSANANSNNIFINKIVPSFFRGMGQALTWVTVGAVLLLLVKVF